MSFVSPPSPPSPAPGAPAPALADTLALRLALAGAANCTAAVVTNPLDVIKVRMQTAPARQGLACTLVGMLREEGAASLYRGLAPSLLREASYSSLRLGLYEPIRDAIVRASSSDGSSSSSLVVKLAAGATSGVIGSAIANPADLLKVRLQAARASDGATLWGEARAVLRDHGPVGLWQGVRPSMARAAMLTASQVGSYDAIKQRLRQCGVPVLSSDGLPLHTASSVLAGFVASCATTPLDYVKTQLMAGRQAYRSEWHCVVHTCRSEGGALQLYAGFAATFLRIGPHTVISMLVFEQLRAACGIAPV